ncbi:MAG: DUF4386 domain-containing protein, partial [Vallitaleaceae bacterium]|nr:DUF4386 domain-containing protein [Vallitaleaceae bacterium]
IVSDIIMSTAFLMMGITFYVLLKSVNKYVALVMLVFNIIGVPIMCLNLMSQYAPLLLLSGADYLSAFSVDQLNALVLFFMNMHHYGYILATISYGTYLLPLGYLVYKSGFMPKILGIMLMIGAFSWLGDLFTKFLIADMNSTISTIIQIPESIAEFSFFFWLIIKGARE